jgi:hypothetical protein
MIKCLPIHCLLLFSSCFHILYITQSNTPSNNYDHLSPGPDPCEEANASTEAATALSKTTKFNSALKEIQKSFSIDGKEHVVAFGKDDYRNIIISSVNMGQRTNGTVPKIPDAFADLHNHPDNHPPDAGDLYGLIDINNKKNNYDTRFVITQNKTIYALVVTDPAAAAIFNVKYPRDLTGCSGCSPKFPEAIVDEFREMKYGYGCTDEMALAFILEKYNAGMSLLKQDSIGRFNKLRTSVSKTGDNLVFTANNCP